MMKMVSPGDAGFWIDLGIVAFLVLFAGMMSGLTLGLLSLDLTNLRILSKSASEADRKRAKKIIPLVKKHHILLVTLLLCNAAAMEALPIFLNEIVNPLLAVIISVTLVLMFGEIIPQAICTRYGLVIGAFMAPAVNALVYLLYIIVWPIAKLLDHLLGHSYGTFFRRAELKELVAIHGHQNALTDDEVLIMRGALDMRSKEVWDILTPAQHVFMLPYKGKLDKATMQELLRRGHSRVPVYTKSRNDIIGMILVKNLIMYDPEDEIPIKDVTLSKIIFVNGHMGLYDMLNQFQGGSSHLAVVKDDQGTFLGLVTLEDIIEELIQEEIVDETDVYVDVSQQLKVAKIFRTLSARRVPNTFPISRLTKSLVPGAETKKQKQKQLERDNERISLLNGPVISSTDSQINSSSYDNSRRHSLSQLVVSGMIDVDDDNYISD